MEIENFNYSAKGSLRGKAHFVGAWYGLGGL